MFTDMQANLFTSFGVPSGMLYGERLQIAIDHRSAVTGQEVTRKQLAEHIGCKVQNIGMIINNSKGRDQKLGAKSHAAAAAYLKVSADWLLKESGPMEIPAPSNAPTELTPAAIELAVLYDMVPQGDKIARAQAFNQATTAIMQVLQSLPAKP